MNILPKKRWHVRTKDNIARVRRDEAKAAEEEKEKHRRALLAEQESRTALLRQRSQQRLASLQGDLHLTSDKDSSPIPNIPTSTNESHASHEETFTEAVFINGSVVSISHTVSKNDVQFSKTGHVNLFADLEEGKKVEGVGNKEHYEEKRQEQEEYEKKIGCLTYLGQGSNEATKEVAWYEQPSMLNRLKTDKDVDTEKIEKDKSFYDPILVMKKYLGEGSKISKKQIAPKPLESVGESSDRKRKHKSEKKNKRDKKHKRAKLSSSSSHSDEAANEKRKSLEKLRTERLKREQTERAKTERLLSKLRGETPVEDKPKASATTAQAKPKYHSQYNPTATRQNLDSNTKYWLQ